MQIFTTLHELLANAKEDGQLQQIDGIGISGQMHGVVLWNDESINRYLRAIQ
jgi:sugar (pentulose or hexulose) kinase